MESSRDDSGFLSPTACSLSRVAKGSIGTRQEAERMSGKHGQEPLPLQKELGVGWIRSHQAAGTEAAWGDSS